MSEIFCWNESRSNNACLRMSESPIHVLASQYTVLAIQYTILVVQGLGILALQGGGGCGSVLLIFMQMYQTAEFSYGIIINIIIKMLKNKRHGILQIIT